MHPCAVKDAKKCLATIDLDQFARIPVVGEFISLMDYKYPLRVEQVLIFPNHGATITVVET
jgi:hypothetical protein